MKMNNRDKRILKELRSSTMLKMDDAEWALIEEEVEKYGIDNLKGYAKSMVEKGMREIAFSMKKATSVKEGDMVSWNSSGGKARGKVIHVMDYGTLDVPDTDFKIKGEKDDPAVLIQLYRDGEPTETQVGHKMSTLKKKK
jgi:hypothetical protein